MFFKRVIVDQGSLQLPYSTPHKMDDSVAELPTLKATLPPGLIVEYGEFGRSIRTSRPFSKGELVGKGRYFAMSPSIDGYQVELTTEDGNSTVEGFNFIHSSFMHETNQRWCFTWCAIINHSCDPNCTYFYPDKEELPEGAFADYDFVALRDIAEGEEMTTCYSMHDWQDLTGREETGFECHCGASVCVKQVQEYAQGGVILEGYRGPRTGFSEEFVRFNTWINDLPPVASDLNGIDSPVACDLNGN